MKKILFLTVSILVLSGFIAKAGNPIPSFNVLVTNNAMFSENPGNPGGHNPPLDEKRDMNVQNGTGGTHAPVGLGTATLTVYVYRTDHSIVQGPFYISFGQAIDVPIDGYPWAVAVTTDFPAAVSVWSTLDQE